MELCEVFHHPSSPNENLELANACEKKRLCQPKIKCHSKKEESLGAIFICARGEKYKVVSFKEGRLTAKVLLSRN